MKKIYAALFLIAPFVLLSFSSQAQFCFDPKVPYVSGIDPRALCQADFNGDHFMDLAVSNLGSGASNVSILLGNGFGNFTFDTSIAVDPLSHAISSADFNGDGFADFATSNTGPGNVSIVLGNGSGHFTSIPGFNTGIYQPNSICSGDFNGDHNADLVISTGFNYVLLELGIGNGNFNPPVQITTGNSSHEVIRADFNIDGKDDLALVTYNGVFQVTVLLGNGSGGFGSVNNYTVGNSPVDLIAADLNGDFKPDLITANRMDNVTGNLSVLIGNGLGGFATAVTVGVGTTTVPKAIVAGDFDNDGFSDLAASCVTSNSIPGIALLHGNGAGSFGLPVGFAVDSFPVSMVASDFNFDGKLDIAAAATRSNIDSGYVSVLLNCNTTGVNENPVQDNNHSVYPNPTSINHEIRFANSGDVDELKVSDPAGREIFSSVNFKSSGSFFIRVPGIYFVTSISKNEIQTQKIIVNRD